MAPIPEWVTEDPAPYEDFQIVRWINDGSDLVIDVTRDEFIALKRHLAAIRGYGLNPPAAVAQFAEETDESDHQQAAFKLSEAREVYRLRPDLVVAESDWLDYELNQWKPGPNGEEAPAVARANAGR